MQAFTTEYSNNRFCVPDGVKKVPKIYDRHPGDPAHPDDPSLTTTWTILFDNAEQRLAFTKRWSDYIERWPESTMFNPTYVIDDYIQSCKIYIYGLNYIVARNDGANAENYKFIREFVEYISNDLGMSNVCNNGGVRNKFVHDPSIPTPGYVYSGAMVITPINKHDLGKIVEYWNNHQPLGGYRIDTFNLSDALNPYDVQPTLSKRYDDLPRARVIDGSVHIYGEGAHFSCAGPLDSEAAGSLMLSANTFANLRKCFGFRSVNIYEPALRLI